MTTDRFHRAAKDGLKDVLREATKRECNGKDEQGMTPTLYAAFYGHLDALRILCGRGGDPDKQDLFGNTAMHLSAAQGHKEIVAFLASFGANVFALDIDQRTPQDVAGVNGREDVLHFLDKFAAHLEATEKKKTKSMKERARKDWEKLNKEYNKFQIKMEANNKPGNKSSRPGTFFNTIRSRMYKSGSISNLQDVSGNMDIKNRQSFTGLTIPKRGLSIVQHKALASKFAQNGGNEFKISEIEDGKRSVRIINGTRSGTEIIFSDQIQDQRTNTHSLFGDINGVASDDEDRPDGVSKQNKLTRSVSQPDFINELNNNNNKTKSTARNVDGGVQHEPSSIFVRPGVGSLAFRKSITHTLYSMPLPDNAIDESSIGSAGSLARQPLAEDDILYGSSDDENTTTPIERFLTAFKLSELIPVFEEQEIDLDTLLKLTEDDLNKLNLKVGHYRNLVIAITERKNALENPGEVVDSML